MSQMCQQKIVGKVPGHPVLLFPQLTLQNLPAEFLPTQTYSPPCSRSALSTVRLLVRRPAACSVSSRMMKTAAPTLVRLPLRIRCPCHLHSTTGVGTAFT